MFPLWARIIQWRGAPFLMACLLFSVLAAGAVCLAEDIGPTARGMFAMLPPSIFENTPEGLSEDAQQELLLNGKSEFWEIAGETPDTLVLAELPFRDRSVALRVFRDDQDGGAVAAIGVIGEPVCSVELWRLDASGRLMPHDTPPEPDIGEFFRKKIKRDPGQTALICLGGGGLMAKPVFWGKKGMIEPKTDFKISYQWNGHEFVKLVEERETKKK